MVPQLAPPKIPEGERVDFDVSTISIWFISSPITFSLEFIKVISNLYHSIGYSQKKDGERLSGVTDFNWCPLWAEEERGGRADWSQGENCNSQSFITLIYHKNVLYSLFSLLCTNFLHVVHSVILRSGGGQNEQSSSVFEQRKNETDRRGLR